MSTQPAWNRPRPHLEKEPQIRTALRQAHLPQNRSCRQRVNTKTPTPAEDAPSGSRTALLGSVLSPYGAPSRPGRPGPPPEHPCVRQARHPRTCQVPLLSGPPRTPPAKYRPYAPGGPSPPPSQESPSQQPRNLENLRLSGGTSGLHWAASAGSLYSYRRPSGQSPWDSWTPCPTCGVCVTTTLPRCPNGARDR